MTREKAKKLGKRASMNSRLEALFTAFSEEDRWPKGEVLEPTEPE